MLVLSSQALSLAWAWPGSLNAQQRSPILYILVYCYCCEIELRTPFSKVGQRSDLQVANGPETFASSSRLQSDSAAPAQEECQKSCEEELHRHHNVLAKYASQADGERSTARLKPDRNKTHLEEAEVLLVWRLSQLWLLNSVVRHWLELWEIRIQWFILSVKHCEDHMNGRQYTRSCCVKTALMVPQNTITYELHLISENVMRKGHCSLQGWWPIFNSRLCIHTLNYWFCIAPLTQLGRPLHRPYIKPRMCMMALDMELFKTGHNCSKRRTSSYVLTG